MDLTQPTITAFASGPLGDKPTPGKRRQSMHPQTLDQAEYLARSGRGVIHRAARALRNLPVGGWIETVQAMGEVENDLPANRSYSVEDFVSRMYETRSGRYCAKV